MKALLDRGGSSALEGWEHIPRAGRHEAISQLSVPRAPSPARLAALCHCHSYNVLLFDSSALLAEDVAVVVRRRKRNDFFASC